jgi:hypothetical protein
MDERPASGRWRVRREAGLLPPLGIGKRTWGSWGCTTVLGVPVAIFRLLPGTLDYVGFPLRDEIQEMPDGSWLGRGLLFGREYCRFRMVPANGAP